MFDFKLLTFFTILMTLGVAFVNGWTDAPNAIVSVVATGTLNIKKAVLFAAFGDLTGALTMGLFNGKVTQTIFNIVDLGENNKIAVISIFTAMTVVVLWSVAAWYFGIPTSESHALVAGLSGSSVAANGGFGGINFIGWQKVMYGLTVSIFAGFISGYLISKITVNLSLKRKAKKNIKFFTRSQIIASFLMSFMHGAQDSQKFAGVLLIIMTLSDAGKKNSLLFSLAVCAVSIAVGTATGGDRIIKTVGSDMVELSNEKGFSADLAGTVCLLFSTLLGFPVSTTHTKTSAIIGTGAAESINSVVWRVAAKMIFSWILTFPFCGFFSWFFSKMLLNLFQL